jgi:tetratricopeptide (TPR) repeat protein
MPTAGGEERTGSAGIAADQLDVEMAIVRSLYERARYSGEVVYLDDALARARRVAASLAASGVSHLGVSADLGRCLSLRYRLAGDAGMLREAIGSFRAAVFDADRADPDLPACLNNLGNALADWYELTRDPAALADAGQAFRSAAEFLPEGDQRLCVVLTGLGDAMHQRYLATGYVSDLDEAIAVAEKAAAAAVPGHPARPVILNGLANVLRERYLRSRDSLCLARAELVLRQAATEAGSSAPDRAMALNGLGMVLNLKYEADGDRDALAEAERVAVECVMLTAPDDPARGGQLNNLGTIRWNTYQASGDLRAQSGSADAYRAAVAGLPETHEHYALSLGNLAGALIDRFETLGDLSALEEGIAALRRVTESMAQPDPRRALYLSLLGGALLRRYERLGGSDVLDEAEDTARQAVEMSAGEAGRSMFLSDLSSILHRRYKDHQDPGALDDAEAALRKALAGAEDDAPGRLLFMSNLGHVLLEQYRRSRDAAALDKAIDVLREAEQRAGRGDSHRPAILVNLGEVLRRRYDADPAPALLAEALTVLGEAAAIPTAGPRQRAKCARSMGELAASAQRWPQTVEAFRLAIDLLPAVASEELGLGDREYGLAEFATLASNAAAAAVQAGDPYQAISLLESGRGVLFAQALQLRSPLDDLLVIAPEMADRFQQLTRQLTAADVQTRPPAPVTIDPRARILGITDQINRRQQIAHERDRVLTEIRNLPGFEDFLRPLTAQRVLDDAGAGPVALLNVSRYRSDAIIVSKGSIQIVPLPAVTPQTLTDKALALLGALRTLTQSATQHEQAEKDLLEILDWLWHAVAQPVLNALSVPEAVPGARRPRLWWVPTGLLSLLPIHAATNAASPGQCVASRVISSYAPTIRALGWAVGRVPPSNDRTLVVAVPSAPGGVTLLAAHAEGQAIQSLNYDATLLAGEAATRDRLLRELPRHENLHFAGHAIGSLLSPSESALLMRDGQVTAREISQLKLTGGNIAYLSACETAVSEITVIDEAINMASACQLAGFRHVIATLWPIRDDIAVQVAKQVWQTAKDSGGPAVSVDNAIEDLRRKHPRQPSIWAAYIHSGSLLEVHSGRVRGRNIGATAEHNLGPVMASMSGNVLASVCLTQWQFPRIGQHYINQR